MLKRHLGISYNSNMQKACEFNNVKNLKNENHVAMHGSFYFQNIPSEVAGCAIMNLESKQKHLMHISQETPYDFIFYHT